MLKNWLLWPIDDLKLFKKEEKEKATKIIKLQLQQPSNWVRPPQRPFQREEREGCFYHKKPGHPKKNCRKLKWDLDNSRRQKQAWWCCEDCMRAFPLLLTNTSRETGITMKKGSYGAPCRYWYHRSPPYQLSHPLPGLWLLHTVGTSNQPLSVFKPEPISSPLENGTGQHICLLVKSTPDFPNRARLS